MPDTLASQIQPPIAMLAELTHRCPLACPYCSNPVGMTQKEAELDTDTWLPAFAEAALGVFDRWVAEGVVGTGGGEG